MKRYDLYYNEGANCLDEVSDGDGYWVKAEDALAEIATLTKSRDDFMKSAQEFADANFELAMWQKEVLPLLKSHVEVLKTLEECKKHLAKEVFDGLQIPKTGLN